MLGQTSRNYRLIYPSVSGELLETRCFISRDLTNHWAIRLPAASVADFTHPPPSSPVPGRPPLPHPSRFEGSFLFSYDSLVWKQ